MSCRKIRIVQTDDGLYRLQHYYFWKWRRPFEGPDTGYKNKDQAIAFYNMILDIWEEDRKKEVKAIVCEYCE